MFQTVSTSIKQQLSSRGQQGLCPNNYERKIFMICDYRCTVQETLSAHKCQIILQQILSNKENKDSVSRFDGLKALKLILIDILTLTRRGSQNP